MATASRSSPSERSRAQVSPTAALVAVAAIGIGLSIHATVLASVAPSPEQDVAEPTLDRVSDAVSSADVVEPERLDEAATAGPEGYDLQVSLRTNDRTWTAGAVPPQPEGGESSTRTETATRRVAIRTGPGSVVTGRLQVVVWR